MNITLDRFAYTATETQGGLVIGSEVFFTIERPWIKGSNPGGKNFESCIPDGVYDLAPFTRPDGDRVFSLSNSDLGVWVNKDERPESQGRYLVLIHSGNTVNDVVGCIAPGESRILHNNQVFVTNSRASCNKIFGLLGDETHKLLIRPALGTE
jgi:hypothetical protein